MKLQKPVDYVPFIGLGLASCLAAALLLCGCNTPKSEMESLSPEPQTFAMTNNPISKRVDSNSPDEREQAVNPVIQENNIYFSSHATIVNDLGMEKLRRHAERLKSNPKEAVSLVGYSDDQGSRSYNLAITSERLSAVAKALKSYRVTARQILRSRIGNRKNLPGCKTDSCRQQMRRVELVFSRQ